MDWMDSPDLTPWFFQCVANYQDKVCNQPWYRKEKPYFRGEKSLPTIEIMELVTIYGHELLEYVLESVSRYYISEYEKHIHWYGGYSTQQFKRQCCVRFTQGFMQYFAGINLCKVKGIWPMINEMERAELPWDLVEREEKTHGVGAVKGMLQRLSVFWEGRGKKVKWLSK